MEDSETRRERFKRLATLRTNTILERLRILGHCANKSAYEYDEKEVDRIFSAIEDELRMIKSKFKAENRQTRQFKL